MKPAMRKVWYGVVKYMMASTLEAAGQCRSGFAPTNALDAARDTSPSSPIFQVRMSLFRWRQMHRNVNETSRCMLKALRNLRVEKL